jgi:hypothetical protein
MRGCARSSPSIGGSGHSSQSTTTTITGSSMLTNSDSCSGSGSCLDVAISHDTTSPLLSAASVNPELLFFIFSPHLLRSEHTWLLIVEHKFEHLLRVLLSLDVARTLRVFECHEYGKVGSVSGVAKRYRTLHSKQFEPFISTMKKFKRDVTNGRCFTHTVAELTSLLVSFVSVEDARELTVYANEIFHLLVHSIGIEAHLGNPLSHRNTSCLLSVFSMHMVEAFNNESCRGEDATEDSMSHFAESSVESVSRKRKFEDGPMIGKPIFQYIF